MVRLRHKTEGYVREFIAFIAENDGKDAHAPFGLTYDTKDNL